MSRAIEASTIDTSVFGIFKMAPIGKPLILVTDNALIHFKTNSDFDEQKPTAKNAAKLVFNGQRLTRISVKWIILPHEINYFFSTIFPMMKEKGFKTNPTQLEVETPLFGLYGLRKVAIDGHEMGEFVAGQKLDVTLNLIEYSKNPVDPKKDPLVRPIAPGSGPVTHSAENTLGSAKGKDGRPTKRGS